MTMSRFIRAEWKPGWNSGCFGLTQIPSVAEPAKVAVDDGISRIDFSEFSRRVDAVAHQIAAQTPERSIVALNMNRSVELLVCMCACLTSARPFTIVPEAELPSRLDYILARSRARLVLRRSQPQNGLSFDVIAHGMADESESLALSPQPADLAYILFTSGSTGEPKGVEVTRAGLQNYLRWAARYYRLDRLDGAMAQLNPAFDAAITQLLLPILCGREVRLIAAGDEIPGLVAALRDRAGSWLVKLTPSQLPAIAEECGQGYSFDASGELIFGGEAFDGVTLAAARALFPNFTIHNEYGPTETVVGSSVFTPSPGRQFAGLLPIGHPIERTTIRIVDSMLREVENGDEGEILIGGEGVTRGYAGHPRETANRFVPDPAQPGARAYRSGDYGRVDADGVLYYLGRKDSQIKLRGFRVELGEVRYLLSQLPAVIDVVVDAPAGDDGTVELHVYVKLAPGATLVNVREQARDRVPAHLIPSQWLEITAIPLNANGKLDIAALRAMPKPVGTMPLHDSDPALDLVMGLWNTVLKHSRFGPDDDFYAVGGHSILAIRLASLLRQSTDSNVALAELVQLSTPRRMSSVAARLMMKQSSEPAVPMVKRFPLSHLQWPMWLAVLDARRRSMPDPYLAPSAIRLRGPLDLDRLHAAFDSVLRRHGVFYTRLSIEGGEVMQTMTAEPLWSWQIEPVSDAAELERRLQELGRMPLDLESGPVVALHVLVHDENDRHLILRMHHLNTDDWSSQIIVDEVARTYGRGVEALGLPPPLDAYGIFCRRQQDLAADDKQLDHWKQALTGAGELARLPRIGASRNSGAGRRASATIPASVTDALRRRARADRISMNTLFVAAVGTGLGLGAGLPQVRLAAPVALRDDKHIAGVCGYFLNTVVFRVDPEPGKRLDEVLSNTARHAGLALANKDVPHGRIAEEVPPMRDGGHAHARFAFIDRSALPVFPGCRVDVVRLDRAGIKFDLLISTQLNSDSIELHFDFDPEVFDPAAIMSWLQLVERTLQALADGYDGKLSALAQEFAQEQWRNRQLRNDELAARLRATSRQARAPVAVEGSDVRSLDIQTPDWLRGAALIRGQSTQSLTSWVSHRRDDLADALLAHGAVLLRGFADLDVDGFESIVGTIGSEAPQDYENRSTPRSRVSNNIFTSTEYPADSIIALHSENAYSARWPRRIMFWCRVPATKGGATPIADNRRVLAAIPADTRRRFESRGVMYLRNYGAMGLSWQETFQTSERQEVETYCRQHGLQWAWMDNGGLRTWQVLPALRRHPDTGQLLWFNQAHLFHVSSLGRDMADDLRLLYREEELPRHACFGDGSAIGPEDLEAIRLAYDQHTVAFDWQPHDVLLLDNMLYSHGRRNYAGSRSVLVGMTNMVDGSVMPGEQRNAR